MRKTVLPFYALNLQNRWMRQYQSRLLLIIFLFNITLSTFSQPATPKFQTYQPVNTTRSSTSSQPIFPIQPNPLLLNDPYREQNYRAMQQAGMDIPGSTNVRQQQLSALKNVLLEEAIESDKRVAGAFQNSFQQFLQLNPDNFSVTKAVYLSESAYDPNSPSYEAFEAGIKEWAGLVRQMLKREGLSEKNNTAVNYAIQKLYTQSNAYYNAKTKRTFDIPPLRYDFNDFMGDKDWRKMFVSKLLQTRTGQCHNLPLFFMCVAEQLNAKTYLSLSPNHSFIQYFDEKGNRYNFETTNGNLVSQTWLAKSTYVNATALKNKTYLDTLSNRKLYAQCLSDLLLSYIRKMGYDSFSDQIAKQILNIDATNIAALMTQANYYYYIFQDKLQAAGNPPENTYSSYPPLYAAYRAMQEAGQKVEQTGFQKMPEEAYLQWLKSLEFEKQKEQNRLEQEKLQREIKRLKNLKSTFINKPKE